MFLTHVITNLGLSDVIGIVCVGGALIFIIKSLFGGPKGKGNGGSGSGNSTGSSGSTNS